MLILAGKALAISHVSPGRMSNKSGRIVIHLQNYLSHGIIAVNILMFSMNQNEEKPCLFMHMFTDAI